MDRDPFPWTQGGFASACTLRKKPVLFSFFEETCIVFFLPTVKLAPPLSYLGGSERERESCICLRELALLAYFSYSFFNLSSGMEAKSLQLDYRWRNATTLCSQNVAFGLRTPRNTASTATSCYNFVIFTMLAAALATGIYPHMFASYASGSRCICAERIAWIANELQS